jgi:lipopolysaccharide/colanic/teichoic acid biosynthesis glycosyltransferase
MTPVCLEPKQYERVNADAGRVLSRELWHGMERIVAAMALIVLVPVLFTIAALIAILSRRNPLIRHTRVGWRGRPLPMLKFRTMWDARSPVAGRFSIETVSGPPPGLKRSVDPRVTSYFAAFCRRHSLDELPQLYHVVSGEMSFVGPRPITVEELSEYYGHRANEILSVRPGMTGLWQVRGRSRLNYARRKHFDLVLVRRASASLYFGILLRSIAAVLSGRDAY